MERHEKARADARRRFAERLEDLHQRLDGVTEEEVLRALDDPDVRLPELPKGNGRRGSASTRTASRPG